LARELAAVPDPGRTRALGDLLLARYAQVSRGASRVTLEDFEGAETVIEIDPALAPHENAERYYDEAGRAERALERLPRLLESEAAETRRLEALLARARVGEATEDELMVELPSAGTEAGRVAPQAALPYRRYRSSGGLEIRVGKGAKMNDELTFRHSEPMDVWLHARDVAGAHVLLRWSREENPPARDLEEAAVLAALSSRARTSGLVPVDWTRRKHVRKPRGAAPGSVMPERVRTVFVAPDAELEERLKKD
jgi:predicted ribosome quality control (RQC) complex YloA/Tae2 family protein